MSAEAVDGLAARTIRIRCRTRSRAREATQLGYAKLAVQLGDLSKGEPVGGGGGQQYPEVVVATGMSQQDARTADGQEQPRHQQRAERAHPHLDLPRALHPTDGASQQRAF